jgi:Tfp pilus assembly protein PilZ
MLKEEYENSEQHNKEVVVNKIKENTNITLHLASDSELQHHTLFDQGNKNIQLGEQMLIKLDQIELNNKIKTKIF